MKTEVDLVNVGGGNIGSVRRWLNRLGITYRTVDSENPTDGLRPLLLPGVGAFGSVMEYIRRDGMDATITRLVRGGTPCLGICVGMQILFESSAESEGVAGLGLVPGRVVRFQHPKVPQIGWNSVVAKDGSAWPSGYVYFVNSYFAQPADQATTLYSANYGGTFCAAIKTGNITAFQFHPEKSGEFGELLLKRWLADVS